MNQDELKFFEKLKSVGQPTAPTEGSPVETKLKVADTDYSTPLTLRNLFFHHDAHPVALDFAMLKAFGHDWFSWEPETIWSEIQHQFKTQISELTKSKIMAIKTVHVVSSPWMHWQVFEKVVQTFTNVIPSWNVMQAPTVEQLYAGIDIMKQLRNEQFDDEVRRYIAACLLHEDIFYAPPPLDFVQVELSKPIYRCRDCEHTSSATTNAGYCPNCTDQYVAENGLAFRPDPNLVAEGRGKNLDLLLTYSPEEVEKRWKAVEKLPAEKVKLEENPVDIQVGKLIDARDYMNIRRKQLIEQLTSLKSWLGAV